MRAGYVACVAARSSGPRALSAPRGALSAPRGVHGCAMQDAISRVDDLASETRTQTQSSKCSRIFLTTSAGPAPYTVVGAVYMPPCVMRVWFLCDGDDGCIRYAFPPAQGSEFSVDPRAPSDVEKSRSLHGWW